MKLSIKARRGLTGAAFVSPFILGFLLFFLYPILQSMFFSLNDLQITAEGYDLTYIGVEHYRTLLVVDADFRRVFVEGMVEILVNIPLILMFSFFAASLLNQRFRGRLFARVVFFLPVIIGADVALTVENAVYMQQAMNLSNQGIFSINQMADTLGGLQLPGGFVEFIVTVVNQVPQIIRSSGIQILIFLAALQSIPDSFYEEARIEGATGWESFWRITFPMLSGLFLVNVIYTIIDSFTSPANDIIGLIRNTTWNRSFGLSVAMSWLYFAAVLVILGITFLLTARRVYYES